MSWPRKRRGRNRQSRGRRLGSIPATRHTPLWHTISTSCAVTSRAVLTLIRLRSSTSAAQQHLAGPALELSQVQLRRRGPGLVGAQLGDPVDRDEHLAPADACQQPNDRRPALIEVQPGNHILDPTKALAVGVEQGLPASEET